MKNTLRLFTMLLGAALFMPILSVVLHYFSILPSLREGCYLQPAVFDGLVSGFLLLIFCLSFFMTFAGAIMYVTANAPHKTAKQKQAKTLLAYGAVGLISIALSFYIFGGFSVGWYGSTAIPCIP